MYIHDCRTTNNWYCPPSLNYHCYKNINIFLNKWNWTKKKNFFLRSFEKGWANNIFLLSSSGFYYPLSGRATRCIYLPSFAGYRQKKYYAILILTSYTDYWRLQSIIIFYEKPWFQPDKRWMKNSNKTFFLKKKIFTENIGPAGGG